TIYHYFASKDALLEAVIEMLVEESVAGLGEMVDGPGGNAIEKIRALAAAARAATGRQADLLGQLPQPGNPGMHARILATSLLKQAPLLERLIRQGRREGLFRCEHPLECAELILAGMQFITDRGVYPWSDEELARRRQALPGLVEAQLSAPAGSFQFLAQ